MEELEVGEVALLKLMYPATPLQQPHPRLRALHHLNLPLQLRELRIHRPPRAFPAGVMQCGFAGDWAEKGPGSPRLIKPSTDLGSSNFELARGIVDGGGGVEGRDVTIVDRCEG